MRGLGGVHEVQAGVPVLASVASLRPMWPDLPTPVTITRPWRARMISTARSNSSPMRAASACGLGLDAQHGGRGRRHGFRPSGN